MNPNHSRGCRKSLEIQSRYAHVLNFAWALFGQKNYKKGRRVHILVLWIATSPIRTSFLAPAPPPPPPILAACSSMRQHRRRSGLGPFSRQSLATYQHAGQAGCESVPPLLACVVLKHALYKRTASWAMWKLRHTSATALDTATPETSPGVNHVEADAHVQPGPWRTSVRAITRFDGLPRTRVLETLE